MTLARVITAVEIACYGGFMAVVVTTDTMMTNHAAFSATASVIQTESKHSLPITLTCSTLTSRGEGGKQHVCGCMHIH